MARTVQEKRAAFRALHAEGCFVLPNPWDIGSARMLQGLGFQALASTSSGFAWSTGGADGTSSRDAVLAHLRALCEATDLPVNADFESGYATTAEGVAESVRMAIATGVAGLSIEDSTGDAAQPLRAVADAVERMRAARAAIDGSGGDTLLVGRAENFIVGRPDLADTIARLKAVRRRRRRLPLRAGHPHARADRRRRRRGEAQARQPAARRRDRLDPRRRRRDGRAPDQRRRRPRARGVGGFLRAARGLAQGRFDGLAGATPGPELNAFFRGGELKR
jgi:hypothetical protein